MVWRGIVAVRAAFNGAGGEGYSGWGVIPCWTSAEGPALGARLRHPRGRRPAHGDVPDILGIFADGAVRREPRHPRDVEDAGARPGRGDLPARVDAALG